jgi:glycosyltransferase involved in cell wall biosynthesis
MLVSGNTKREIEKAVRNFDVAFFPWPFFLRFPNLNCPVVATIHDLNFKYFFGSPIFDDMQIDQLESQIPIWLENATPIVSSFFMRAEIEKFYPDCASKVNVVHLAPLCGDNRIEFATAKRIVAELDILPPYMIYPTNTCAHKNIASLVSALYLLTERGFEIKLVLTGNGTESLTGRASQIGIERGSDPANIIGLGYVTNRQIDSLIKCAVILVTPSLYEAGNGPGVDAWSLGVPVAMSDVPCFSEHLHHQQVQAELFDPLNPDDIANKIAKILTDPKYAASMAKNSQTAINKMTWASVAEKYLTIFKKAVNGQSNER